MDKTIPRTFFTDRNVLILIISIIGMLPVLLNVHGFYIGGDVTSQMLPFVYETKRMFASGVPFWSWNTYFGDNFIASYAYYTVFNPFTWLNCLFPYKYLGVGFTIVMFLKFLVCGYVAQKYLKKIGYDSALSLLGCILYTFSSWAVSNLPYYIFMEPMILFPFLLIFVERFLRKESHCYTGLAMATFFVVAVNYYFATCNLIAASIYFFCRITCSDKYGGVKKRLILSLKALACVCLGIVCASALLIPVFNQLIGSPRASVKLTFTDVFLMAERAFWLLFPKAHEGKFYYLFLTSGCRSNAAGIAVFGILPALLLYAKKDYRWIKWLTAVFAIIYLTPINGIFSLLTEFNNSRWAYALTLAIIICTLYYIRDYGFPRFRQAVWYCAVVYGMYFLFTAASIYYHYQNSGAYGSLGITRLCYDAALVTVNAVALLAVCSGCMERERMYAVALTSVVVCAAMQLSVFSLHILKEISSRADRVTENGYFTGDYDFRENGDFRYRTNFSVADVGDGPPCNFGLICNRPSLSTYHSVQNRRIHQWNYITGKEELPGDRLSYPHKFVKSFEALMSVKELGILSPEPLDTCHAPDTGKKDGFLRFYESDHYIPMGFVYDRYVLADEIENMANNDRTADIPMILLSALAIREADEEQLATYLKPAEKSGPLSLDSLVERRKTIVCDRFTGHSHGFDAHINLDSTRVVFFSVLADPGFKAFIDGVPTKIFDTNLGFSSVVVSAGSHDITFRYFPPGFKLGVILSLMGLSILAFAFIKRL